MTQHAQSPDPGDRDLTPRRRKVLQFIQDSIERNGYPPSIREIGEASGLQSTSAVSYQVSVLQKQGYLSREAGRPRTTAVIRAPVARIARVPLVGAVKAGDPILVPDEIDVEDVFPLPVQLVGEGDFIMLKVAGESMTGAAINDGDFVVVRLQEDAENGEIVAALVESDTAEKPEATVKTFKKRDGHVWLMPNNPAFTPIPGDTATIIGKVVTVLRSIR
jgi:repressor LexA